MNRTLVIPDFLFPVVLEKLDIGGQACCAGMAQVGRNAEVFITKNQQGRHNEPDNSTGSPPGPGLRELFHFQDE